MLNEITSIFTNPLILSAIGVALVLWLLLRQEKPFTHAQKSQVVEDTGYLIQLNSQGQFEVRLGDNEVGLFATREHAVQAAYDHWYINAF